MIIIGEKLNGFIPKTLAAIEAKDEGYIKEIIAGQVAGHADYLDICAGVEAEREMEVMEWLIGLAQANSDLPLCLDSSDPQILLDCMKLANKPGMINSVSMEDGKIEAIFPAIADTEWKVVALTCNNDGIPDDPPTKLAIAKEIMAECDKYGIDHDRVFIDPLVTTLATKGDSMANFMEGVRLIKEEFPRVHFTSGLSNISFGMPARRCINMQFACLAMCAGMDSAIMDPMSADLQGAVAATAALLGQDEWCMNYLTMYRENLLPVKSA